MDPWRIALVVIGALFLVLLGLRLLPAGEEAEERRAERRRQRRDRRRHRAERRLLRGIAALPLESKKRVRDAVNEMIDEAARPPE